MGHTGDVSPSPHTGTAQGLGKVWGWFTCAGLKVHPPSHSIENGFRLFEDLLLHERTEVTCPMNSNKRGPFQLVLFPGLTFYQDKVVTQLVSTTQVKTLQVSHQVLFA